MAVECRLNDSATLELLSHARDDTAVWMAVAERALMARLEGGCSVPIGVHCSWVEPENSLFLKGFVYSTVTGEFKCLTAERTADVLSGDVVDEEGRVEFSKIYVPPGKRRMATVADRLGRMVADDLLALGAGEILKAERNKNSSTP